MGKGVLGSQAIADADAAKSRVSRKPWRMDFGNILTEFCGGWFSAVWRVVEDRVEVLAGMDEEGW